MLKSQDCLPGVEYKNVVDDRLQPHIIVRPVAHLTIVKDGWLILRVNHRSECESIAARIVRA
jgi:hypothetical protein